MFGALTGSTRVRRPVREWCSTSSTRPRRAHAKIAHAHLPRDLTDTAASLLPYHSARTFAESAAAAPKLAQKPEAIARAVYDRCSMGRLRLMVRCCQPGIFRNGRAALANLSLALLEQAGATYER